MAKDFDDNVSRTTVTFYKQVIKAEVWHIGYHLGIYLSYVHQLQHILWALGLDAELKKKYIYKRDMKFGIIDFMMASLQVAFIVMKLCGAISWSWWLVLLPMLLIVVFNILVLLFYVYMKVYESHQLIKYTTDQIVSNRDMVERAIESQLSKALAKEHFQLEQLTSGLKYPNSIVEAVNQKNKAIQEAQRALNEVAVKKAEAEKMLVQARAEREANELKSATLTPAILKKMWIEKWDGKLPVYGNVPQIMMTK